MTDPLDGLDEAGVRERVRRGDVNEVPRIPGRTVREIVRANVFTPFNALLGAMFVLILLVGPAQDALFGVVLVANTAIGIFQELRAKRTLDRLTVLTAPRARVVRAEKTAEVEVGEVVLDDVLELRPGDQVVVDGIVLSSAGLEVDESLLSGESEPPEKEPGDEVLSGSFVAAGSGRYRATRVGPAAYASSLAQQAKRFTLVRSELREGINRILLYVTWAIVPTATLLFVSQFRLHHSWHGAVAGAVAGTVGMVPEGLVLLTSVAFGVAVVRLARKKVLVQELPAVEGLARVDVLCTDKTGTLTEGRLRVHELEVLAPEVIEPVVAEALGQLAAVDPAPNATMSAIQAAYSSPATRWDVDASMPFSSARKWSGTSFKEHGTWILGAPSVLLEARSQAEGAGQIAARVKAHAEGGRRVVLLARSETKLDGEALPADLEPISLVVLQDRVRADAPAILGYFERQGVVVKVISGDDPATVAAIAKEVRLKGWVEAIDGRSLPEEPELLADTLESHAVFGRVSPQQKRSMIAALQSRGHVVAMTGDGVNDVLALKDADIGVAMGSGSAASRATAQLVLLDSSFAALPDAVSEGRRVIANIERTGNLFLTKTVYAMLLALSVGVAGVPFPFLPRHLTLISALTIGIPGFFLALAPSDRPARSGFIGRILRFAVPAGVLAAAGTFAAYALARAPFGTTLVVARSTATVVLFTIGLVILTAIASPLTALRRWLVATMGAVFLTVIVVPPLRVFFALVLPPMIVWLAAGAIAAVFAPLIWLLIRRSREQQPPIDLAGLRAALGMEESPAPGTAEPGTGSPPRAGRLLTSVRSRLPGLIAWGRERLDQTSPRGLPLTMSVAAVVVAVWAFGGLVQDVLGHDDSVLTDPRVTSLVVAERVGWLTLMMRILTWFGSNAVLVPSAFAIGGSFLVRRRDPRPLVLLAAALGGAVALYAIVQPIVARPRPPSSIWIGDFGGAAFPSGHPTAAVAFYATLAFILSGDASYRRRALVWSGAALVALVVGASRVYLGAEWLTDVLGGYALGAAWVALLITISLITRSRAPVGTGERAERASPAASASRKREAA
jgi:magnesium-transporting ATPase (P-type)/membrane-associated phospholipid phosphatase